ncbi:metallophosphoesterase family protein [Methanorbis rubei]|uniref:3',5'-cyclic adenosine monophosphate phosphodiesterase CpdA n=1 Tax=Methanorbis rubei TaxID=3028300 RepID=A0AAE4MFY2_9EURY|nr:3',5'-cyclic adenosine monophosphate phosphodiesterase CpdA [Methanocorpusculaceae archaeon Cs1]
MNLKIMVFSITLLLLFCGPACAGVAMGPYITQTTENSTVISFVTDNISESLVEVQGCDAVSDQAAKYHHVQIANLDKNTGYLYRVTADGEITPWYQFKTFGSGKITFAVVGDTQQIVNDTTNILEFSETERHGLIAGDIAASHPDIVIHTGDLVYDGSVYEYWTDFFTAADPYIHNVTLVAAPGNHDIPYITYSLWHDLFGDRYYTADAGPVTFIVLDTSVKIRPNYYPDDVVALPDIDAQLVYLESELAVAEGRKIVIFHQPLFSSNDPYRQQVTDAQHEKMLELFDYYSVDFVFSGHEHWYEHYLIGSTHHIISGTSGAAMIPQGIAPAHELNSFQYHTLGWQLFEATSDSITGKRLIAADISPDNQDVLKTYQSTVAEKYRVGNPFAAILAAWQKK